jgi:uncharacterized protein
MTDITPLIPAGKKIIESYGAGAFKVTGEKFENNIIIFPDSIHKFQSSNIENAKPEDIAEIEKKADEIEILLVGCGAATEFFSNEIEVKLKNKNINIEYMDTGAACRTYNVLLSEERKVAVVLIAV